MAKIVAGQYEPVFDLGLKVEAGQLKASEAIDRVTKKTGLNATSAKYCLDAVLAMAKGDVYKHTINIPATKYYLKCYEEILPTAQFELVLESVEKHLAFYVAQGKGEQVTIQKQVDCYRAKLAQQVYPDEVSNQPLEFTEGAVKQVTINAYERNPKARAACIAKHGTICQVCDLNFESKYGKIGKGFIHVHHKVDLATISESYQVDPINDLIPVCPNCHAMLHTEKPAMDIGKLKQILATTNVI
ncbi:HNH endonuclease [Vibrio splendidus]|jgi:5-methylcytosine-specific restriction enzyme A|uniref:HNH endonuclease n=1 Tax=Vibrio splendidus TaxID=29497 RepID=UPI000D383689|nr:HNH endonuclease [Vibrio splendidus]PTO57747.1 HNH endonuclease [Vibrio splendidus]PTO66159.1 HNH endonuclease [Vibrio splendidus]PTP00836.1 HNH endonuclease [Vibrio splendidus]PTP38860.1 HNH endonuclease [Vibrio splendidus]PTQ05424.1 HNH endonuclease [Vibrio splendidus]